MTAAGESGEESSSCCVGERQSLQVSCRWNFVFAFHLPQPGHLHCCAQMRTGADKQVAPRQRAVTGAHTQHIVLLSICVLTMVEVDICQRR